MIAFVSDEDEFAEEIGYLRSVGEKLAPRINLRIGIVGKPNIIRYYRQEYQAWFPKKHPPVVWPNSLILKQWDGGVVGTELKQKEQHK